MKTYIIVNIIASVLTIIPALFVPHVRIFFATLWRRRKEMRFLFIGALLGAVMILADMIWGIISVL